MLQFGVPHSNLSLKVDYKLPEHDMALLARVRLGPARTAALQYDSPCYKKALKCHCSYMYFSLFTVGLDLEQEALFLSVRAPRKFPSSALWGQACCFLQPLVSNLSSSNAFLS